MIQKGNRQFHQILILLECRKSYLVFITYRFDKDFSFVLSSFVLSSLEITSVV